MAQAQKISLVCSACGYQAHQWMGRCPECRAWDSFEKPATNTNGSAPVPVSAVAGMLPNRLATGIAELDRVLGGGLVAGSVVLLSGEPGVGKSTLMLQAAASLECRHATVLLVCGEESLEQVAARAGRIGGNESRSGRSQLNDSLLVSETNSSEVCRLIPQADVVVVDSIQTLRSEEFSSEPGSVSQVKACAAAVAHAARACGTPVLLIGHITKEGTVAGPRSLEHLVDAVLLFEGDRSSSLRMIRASKNRFGSTGEVGVFEMTESGLVEVPDASKLFLADRIQGAPGSSVGCILEGRRALAVEIQALCGGEASRRVANGLDVSKLTVIAAVLERCAGMRLGRADVYASLAGGVRTSDPGADLALALSIASSHHQRGLAPELIAIGELGLTGELRRVPGMESRVAEAERLGFAKAVVPRSFDGRTSMEVLRCSDINSAVNSLVTT